MASPDGNLFHPLPANLDVEVSQDVLHTKNVRIERILSRGQTSPATGWYDQEENEWVAVQEGAATIAFDDGREVRLGTGDHLAIPAHRRHRVAWTAPARVTVWLAVFYR